MGPIIRVLGSTWELVWKQWEIHRGVCQSPQVENKSESNLINRTFGLGAILATPNP
jgi:hypothetical protein